eukprot:TRINITY_DN13055_c0_g1_i1.p1 TRINITY_DN13055_c0_g1~~TRINITY_DN13055_c0_g1_i1.p1  ORF type:complete len:101 (-),score=9.97 TRINITY_DN13055_c0_g1_i1:28-330(-)
MSNLENPHYTSQNKHMADNPHVTTLGEAQTLASFIRSTCSGKDEFKTKWIEHLSDEQGLGTVEQVIGLDQDIYDKMELPAAIRQCLDQSRSSLYLSLIHI